MIDIKEGVDSITFRVLIIPRASRSEIAGEMGGAVKVTAGGWSRKF
ncbi:hypothetical protein BH24ACI3_BH24ACI3_10050 [soil metagenome]